MSKIKTLHQHETSVRFHLLPLNWMMHFCVYFRRVALQAASVSVSSHWHLISFWALFRLILCPFCREMFTREFTGLSWMVKCRGGKCVINKRRHLVLLSAIKEPLFSVTATYWTGAALHSCIWSISLRRPPTSQLNRDLWRCTGRRVSLSAFPSIYTLTQGREAKWRGTELRRGGVDTPRTLLRSDKRVKIKVSRIGNIVGWV